MAKSFFGGLMDNFKSADFSISGKTKVKSLQADFKKNLRLTLRVYNGVKFADPDKTLDSFKSSEVKSSDDFSIKAKMKVIEVEKYFKDKYGLKVQIADADDTHLVPNKITLGEAGRKEYE